MTKQQSTVYASYFSLCWFLLLYLDHCQMEIDAIVAGIFACGPNETCSAKYGGKKTAQFAEEPARGRGLRARGFGAGRLLCSLRRRRERRAQRGCGQRTRFHGQCADVFDGRRRRALGMEYKGRFHLHAKLGGGA